MENSLNPRSNSLRAFRYSSVPLVVFIHTTVSAIFCRDRPQRGPCCELARPYRGQRRKSAPGESRDCAHQSSKKSRRTFSHDPPAPSWFLYNIMSFIERSHVSKLDVEVLYSLGTVRSETRYLEQLSHQESRLKPGPTDESGLFALRWFSSVLDDEWNADWANELLCATPDEIGALRTNSHRRAPRRCSMSSKTISALLSYAVTCPPWKKIVRNGGPFPRARRRRGMRRIAACSHKVFQRLSGTG